MNSIDIDGPERLLTAGEVAKVFRVHPKTVARWANQGQIASVRTPGGHRRITTTEVKRVLSEGAPS